MDKYVKCYYFTYKYQYKDEIRASTMTSTKDDIASLNVNEMSCKNLKCNALFFLTSQNFMETLLAKMS